MTQLKKEQCMTPRASREAFDSHRLCDGLKECNDPKRPNDANSEQFAPNLLRKVLEKVYPGLSMYPPGSAAWKWAIDHPDLLTHALEQVMKEKTTEFSEKNMKKSPTSFVIRHSPLVTSSDLPEGKI